MPINKFTTLQDLARQAKIISGETATFDGKIQVGIPFSGYPTGVDTGTTVSLGIVSSEDAVFSGNTGTTIFDVSNTGSTNYSPIFSGYTASTWTNPLFSGNTSGLTLPITPLSADTQIVGPFWTLTQTGMTGDYVIGTQYTGYSVTYSFFNVSQIGTGFTYSGFTTASQENFSAGTLDYKGPLDYISTKEDASVEGRLTTNKITITNGASASTIGYVLTQTGENGEGEWSPISGGTNVSGGAFTAITVNNRITTTNANGNVNLSDYSSILGGQNNTLTGSTNAVIIGGDSNSLLDSNRGIIAGSGNSASGDFSFVYGRANTISNGGNYNTIINGISHTMTLDVLSSYNTMIGNTHTMNGNSMVANSILGGQNHSITTDGALDPINSSILGGNDNTIDGPDRSTILGGQNNTINSVSNNAGVLGGEENVVLGESASSVIMGGSYNTINPAQYAFIGGGILNGIGKPYGGTAGASVRGSAIVGGNSNVISAATTNHENSSIIGGVTNLIYESNNSGIFSSINSNINNSDYSVIIGGENNTSLHNNSHIIGSNLTTDDIDTTFIENLTVRGENIVHSDIVPSSSASGLICGNLTYFSADTKPVGAVFSNISTSAVTGVYVGNYNISPNTPQGGLLYYGSNFIRTGSPVFGADSYQNKVVIKGSSGVDGMVINPNGGNPNATLWFEIDGNSVGVLHSSSGYLGLGLNPDGSEMPSSTLQLGGTGTTGTFKFLDGNQQSGYVMTSDANGNVSWQTPTTFTGNTSGDCITDLYVRRLYGCSPITVHDTITYNGSIIDSATTNSFIFGSNHVLTASSLTHGVNADANVILGGNDNRITPDNTGFYNTIIGGYGNEINSRINYASIIGATNSNISNTTLAPTTIIGGNSNSIRASLSSVIIGGEGNFIENSDRTIILGGSGITGTTDDTVYTPDLNVSGDILVENTNGSLRTDIQNSVGPLVLISGGTSDLPRFGAITPSSDSITMGVRGGSDVSYPGYGNQGDSFIYSSNPNNGINIISSQGTGTDDYIRFYAGQDANGTTPDLYIQGSGSTRGYVGINTDSPTNYLDIDNSLSGFKGLRIRRGYTPSSSGDTNGEVGTITWDNNYIYVKTGSGWGRAQLDFTF